VKPNKRIIPIVAAIAVVFVAAIWVLWGRAAKRNIVLSGNIELTQVDIAFKVPGKLIERPVDEGQAVKKGQLVGRLDPEQVKRQRDSAAAAQTAAESQLRQMLTAVAYQKELLNADVELRGAELRQAEARLSELLAGSRRQEIEAARAALDEAVTEERRATRDWERAQTLYKNDDISTSQHDQFQARYKAAVATATQLRERLALVEEGPRKEEIEAARAQVARARAALRLSEANRLELRRKEQETDARRAEVQRARALVAVTDSQVEDTAAFSPMDGYVLSKAAEVGQVLAAGSTVVTIGDLDHPWLRGYINEKDLGRVKLGARVKVTNDSFPGKVYWGRVSFISSEAEFTPKQIQTREERVKLVYRIKIEIPNPQHELKSNMPVDAEILMDTN